MKSNIISYKPKRDYEMILPTKAIHILTRNCGICSPRWNILVCYANEIRTTAMLKQPRSNASQTSSPTRALKIKFIIWVIYFCLFVELPIHSAVLFLKCELALCQRILFSRKAGKTVASWGSSGVIYGLLRLCSAPSSGQFHQRYEIAVSFTVTPSVTFPL